MNPGDRVYVTKPDEYNHIEFQAREGTITAIGPNHAVVMLDGLAMVSGGFLVREVTISLEDLKLIE